MTKRAAAALVVLVQTAAIAGCSSASPAAGRAATSKTNLVAASPSAPAGPAAFNLDWTQSDFVQSACPASHAKATCYRGTASGTLPIVGPVALQRSVYTTGPEDANGCVVATTDGTLTGANGTLTFHATGKLCDLLATYKLTHSHGSGSLAGVTVTGTITNNAGAETWTGTVAP